MGEVIEFRALSSGPRQRRNAAESAGDCQILFFTGVRYERHGESEPEAPATRPSMGAKPKVGSRRGKKRA